MQFKKQTEANGYLSFIAAHKTDTPNGRRTAGTKYRSNEKIRVSMAFTAAEVSFRSLSPPPEDSRRTRAAAGKRNVLK